MNKKLTNPEQFIIDSLNESADVKRAVAQHCTESITTVCKTIAASFKAGNQLLICGNGGSASDSEHLAGEFTCRLSGEFNRPAMPAVALTANTNFLTAFTNDFGFDRIFERQVEAIGKKGDVLLGISTSGNSENVIKAVKLAKKKGITTVALCGDKGNLVEICDYAICVPTQNNMRIQEAHIVIYHLICYIVEREVYGE